MSGRACWRRAWRWWGGGEDVGPNFGRGGVLRADKAPSAAFKRTLDPAAAATIRARLQSVRPGFSLDGMSGMSDMKGEARAFSGPLSATVGRKQQQQQQQSKEGSEEKKAGEGLAAGSSSSSSSSSTAPASGPAETAAGTGTTLGSGKFLSIARPGQRCAP